MTPHAAEILRRFDALDRALVAKGFPATSPWWRATLVRFYESARRQLVTRAGRRAGKSSTLVRLAVVEALYGHHKIPPGDVGVVAFISTTRDEAAQRLRTIEAILSALGVKYRRAGDTIEITGRPVIFKTFTGSVQGVSGFTAICVICDEVSKWKDVDTGANPATEVLASVRPTMATQPEARIVLSSSPMSTLDAHHDAFEAGDTDYQIVAHAATWDANPTISEADTHKLEPHEPTWRREYAAIPLTELESSLLTASEIAAVTRSGPLELPFERGHCYVAAMDPALVRDAWTLAIATCKVVDGRARKVIASVKQWHAPRGGELSPDIVLRDIAAHLQKYSLDYVWSDQAGLPHRDTATRHGLSICIKPSTATGNLEIYQDLRAHIADKRVELPPDPLVASDLVNVRLRVTAGAGGFRIELPRVAGRHCDYAPPIALLVAKSIAEPDGVGPEPGTPEFRRLEEERIEREQQEQWDREQREARIWDF